MRRAAGLECPLTKTEWGKQEHDQCVWPNVLFTTLLRVLLSFRRSARVACALVPPVWVPIQRCLAKNASSARLNAGASSQ